MLSRSSLGLAGLSSSRVHNGPSRGKLHATHLLVLLRMMGIHSAGGDFHNASHPPMAVAMPLPDEKPPTWSVSWAKSSTELMKSGIASRFMNPLWSTRNLNSSSPALLYDTAVSIPRCIRQETVPYLSDVRCSMQMRDVRNERCNAYHPCASVKTLGA